MVDLIEQFAGAGAALVLAGALYRRLTGTLDRLTDAVVNLTAKVATIEAKIGA